MTMTDILLLVLIAGGTTYGIVRGIRPALFLLVTFLAALLAIMLLTVPIENLVLDLTGIGSENYPGAPAVAVLILEGQPGNAYLAAFIPTMLVLFLILVQVIGGILLGQFIRDASRSATSRIMGAIGGFLAGCSASLIVAVQLVRMPWPVAGDMFRGSLLMSALNHIAEPLIPALAGGL